MKPKIGITSGLGSDRWLPDGEAWWPYADAVRRAGGEPVHLDRRTLGRERAVLAELQGVLFSGGKDVDLTLYPNPPEYPGETPEAVMARHRMRPEPDRDSYELPLLREALERDLPVFGICRGCQVLNVALGGRLILDIPLETGTPIRHHTDPAPDGASSCHEIRIAPGTLLAKVFGEGVRVCNSRHHQAVRQDETLTAAVSAVSTEDGLVEAIEVTARRWVVGVQWHPEHPGDPAVRESYAPLFEAFVRAAS